MMASREGKGTPCFREHVLRAEYERLQSVRDGAQNALHALGRDDGRRRGRVEENAVHRLQMASANEDAASADQSHTAAASERSTTRCAASVAAASRVRRSASRP